MLSTAMGTNHAHVGVATQSSTFEDNTPELAIDGNLIWSESCSNTNDDYEPWWKIRFKYKIRVSEIVIVNHRENSKLSNELFR